MALPLGEVSMLEAASEAATPALRAAIGLCGRVAADLGARVTRIVPAGWEDDTPFLQAGKRTLRGHGAERASLLAALAAQSDVLVCDAAILDSAAPRRVRAVLSMDGSASGDAAQSEFTIEAQSGLLDIVGDPARAPLRLGGHQTAYAAGLAAYAGVAAALCQPALSEGPRHVRVSLLEIAVWLNWKSLAVVLRGSPPPKRPGFAAEWPVLPCADGHVAVVHRVQEWPTLLRVIDDPALHEERFQSIAGRRAHRAALNAILARFFATRTRTEIHALSLRHKLPFGPVLAPDEVCRDPQMLARGMFRPVAVTNGATAHGIAWLPRLPVLWNGEELLPADHADGVADAVT